LFANGDRRTGQSQYRDEPTAGRPDHPPIEHQSQNVFRYVAKTTSQKDLYRWLPLRIAEFPTWGH